jgi:hypothetical protein
VDLGDEADSDVESNGESHVNGAEDGESARGLYWRTQQLNLKRKQQDKVLCTVGAQSIACAQSIAPSLIGDNICEKNLNFWKIIFTEDRKGNSAAHSWTKNHIFSFKSGK